MNQIIILGIGVICLSMGAVLGYLTRQSIARRDHRTIEAKIHKKISQAKEEVETILSSARNKAAKIAEQAQKETIQGRRELSKTEQLLLKREHVLDKRISGLDQQEKDFQQKVEKLKGIKERLEELKEETLKKLEKAGNLSEKEAKKELLKNVEQKHQQEILSKIRELEKQGIEKFEKKAKEIVALAIQKYAPSQAQEITTTTISLPNEEIKGRIIGKEGRNIRAFEKLTGVEVVIDETPQLVVLSAFNPIRRHIAKIALEKLIQDGRIQPTRIEEEIAAAQEQITKEVKEAGEAAVYDVGVIGLDPKLIQLLGRLKFRTSFGQSVLLHSIEVAHLAGALAQELGADVRIARTAGLLHDIGKSIDRQIEGSHVDIGIKILEKFKVEKEVIDAMKSHHEEYPYESLEAVLIQTADAISGARPGARKDTLENYLKRLGELEDIATSFSGVNKAYAIQAGREIRVFVNPQEVDDIGAYNLARGIAKRIEEELKYPGEIKVNVIRESRVVEYAK
ncbi:ribonuclease Y [Candidatus Parcubacteria bacterium]|nr:ribonuclease Y [Candidatus Parcubacteria bacterium]